MKKLKKKIDVTVEFTDTGYSAFSEDVGVFTTGSDVAELHDNLLEAFNLAYEDAGIEIGPENLRVTVDLRQFFQHYSVLNARFLAKRIGMNPALLSQYVQGRKRPSPRQTEKIMNGIRSIGRELAEIRLL